MGKWRATEMKVLLVHNYYRYFGGEDMAADNDFRLLASHGVEVRRYSRHNDETLRYGAWEKAFFPIRAIHSSDTVASLDGALRDFPADVAYVHNIYPLISPSIYSALFRRGVPIVQVLHDYRPFCANGWLYTEGRTCERCTGGRHWHAVVHKCMHHSRAISAIYAASLWNLKRSGAFDRVSVFLCPSEFSRLQAVKNGIEPGACAFARTQSTRAALRRGRDRENTSCTSAASLGKRESMRYYALSKAFRRLPCGSRERGLWRRKCGSGCPIHR